MAGVKTNSDIPVAELRRLFTYNPDDGELRWAVDRNGGAYAGDVAGTNTGRGYLAICTRGKNYRVHRIVWAIVHGEWPELQIDHINGIRDDNRLCNLRLATAQQNMIGRRGFSRPSASGYRGVHRTKGSKPFRAYARINGKNVILGYFHCPKEAHAVHVAAVLEHHGEFAYREYKDWPAGVRDE